MTGHRWTPDWQALLAAAPRIIPTAKARCVYLVADAHVGDAQAPTEAFLAMLERLEAPSVLVLMGDLFQVWLALPRFWDTPVRAVLEGLARARARGIQVVFVVGNREFFLPVDAATAQRRGLPLDVVIPDMGILEWGGRRLALTHGDVVNRADRGYLRWRAAARSPWMERVFALVPGSLALRFARRTEQKLMEGINPYKLHLPEEELRAFAAQTLVEHAGAYVGHFHRDLSYTAPGASGRLRIVPDWLGTRTVLRLSPEGAEQSLRLPE